LTQDALLTPLRYCYKNKKDYGVLKPREARQTDKPVNVVSLKCTSFTPGHALKERPASRGRSGKCVLRQRSVRQAAVSFAQRNALIDGDGGVASEGNTDREEL
jgi:hypothetical protein